MSILTLAKRFSQDEQGTAATEQMVIIAVVGTGVAAFANQMIPALVNWFTPMLNHAISSWPQ